MKAPYSPYALYAGVLHDAAGGVAKGVSQWVRWDDGWRPLILLRLAVLSSCSLPTESLNTLLNLTKKFKKRHTQMMFVSHAKWAEKKGEKWDGVKTSELHPEAQWSGKVWCHNGSRSKWKDDTNIRPTALSLITPAHWTWRMSISVWCTWSVTA